MVDMPLTPTGQAVPIVGQGITQNVSFTATSAQSSAFGDNTQGVYISADQVCWVLQGVDPTADTTGGATRLPADSILFWGVSPGEKIAVIRDSADGTLNITEIP